MNFVQIAGHLGADPEERRTSGGKKVVTLRVATNTWVDGKEETMWWMVSVWGDEFDNMLKHMKKGSAIWVLGVLRKPRIWNDRDGKPQVSLEINARVLSFNPFGKSERAPGSENAQGAEGYQKYPSGMAAPGGPMGGAAPGGPGGGFGAPDFASSGFSSHSSGYQYESSGDYNAEDDKIPF